MKLSSKFLIACVLGATSVAIVQAPVFACGNSYRYELDPKTNLLVKAEEALSEGDYKQAWRLATDATGPVGKAVEGKDKPSALQALRARTLRVASIAAIRTKGDVAGKKSADHVATWAVDQLRVLVQREGGNPYLQARLAEGLAQQHDGAPEALTILKQLAADDLMPDAQAWLLYAQLLDDAKERDRAIEQCRLRSNDPAICKVKGPGES
jgi:hypothetical protein